MDACACNWSTRTGTHKFQIPRALWPASLVKVASFCFRERPFLKEQGEADTEKDIRHLPLASKHTQGQAPAHSLARTTHTHTHTQSHTHNHNDIHIHTHSGERKKGRRKERIMVTEEENNHGKKTWSQGTKVILKRTQIMYNYDTILEDTTK